MKPLKKDKMTASEAKSNFGELLDSARARPVKIEKNGRFVAVVVSAEEFERLEALEDAWWGQQAELALKEGLMSEEESDQLLAEWMNAKD